MQDKDHQQAHVMRKNAYSSNLLLLWGLCTVVLVAACAPKKHLNSSLDKEEWTVSNERDKYEYMDSLVLDSWDFHSIQARAKGFLTINHKDNHEVNIQIRMIKDEAIWMSATALLGLEVGRVLLTPDSIRIINRMESTYYNDTYHEGSKWLGEELDFVNLQRLIVGNAPESMQLYSMIFARNERGGGYFSGAGRELIFDEYKRLMWWKGQQLDIKHAYNSDVLAPVYPDKSTLSLQSGALKLLATLEYTRLEFGEELSLPFKIPNGYTQIQ